MNTKTNAKYLPLIAALALFGAGCWVPGKTPAKPSSPQATVPALMEKRYDACQLMTKDDAAAVLGMSVNDPLRNAAQTNDAATTVSSCSYATAGTSDADTKGLSLLVRKSPSKADAIKVFADARKNSKSISGVEPVDVNGLGDAAYWSGGQLTQMNVLVGDAWYIINVRNLNGNEQRMAMDAATRAIGKLK